MNSYDVWPILWIVFMVSLIVWTIVTAMRARGPRPAKPAKGKKGKPAATAQADANQNPEDFGADPFGNTSFDDGFPNADPLAESKS